MSAAPSARDLAELLARVKAHSPVPVALGFGISTGAQAAAAADGRRGRRDRRLAARAGGRRGRRRPARDPAAAAGNVVAELAAALVR